MGSSARKKREKKKDFQVRMLSPISVYTIDPMFLESKTSSWQD